MGRRYKARYLTGNCWSYALPKFWKQGGYLAVRPAPGQRLFGYFPIYHVIWIKEFSRENKIEQIAPIKRKTNMVLPWYVFYFKGKVSRVEIPKNAVILGKENAIQEQTTSQVDV